MAEEKTENQTEEKATSQEETAESQAADAAEGTEKPAEAAEEKKEQTPEERIAALEKENADLKDQLLRRAADFDNYRKRMMKEKQDTYDYANAGLLGDLLDSLDNFDRTIDAAKDAKDAKAIADGIKMINKNLVKMLEDNTVLQATARKETNLILTSTKQSAVWKMKKPRRKLWLRFISRATSSRIK